MKEETESETTRNKTQPDPLPTPLKCNSPADSKLQPDRSNQSKKQAKPSPKAQKSKSIPGDITQTSTASRNDARNKKNTSRGMAIGHGSSEPTYNLMARGEGLAGEIEQDKESRKALTPPPQLEKKGNRGPAIIGRSERVASPTSNKAVTKVAWRGQTQPRSPAPTSVTPPPGKAPWDSQPTTNWDDEDIECLDDVMSSATDDDKLSESVCLSVTPQLPMLYTSAHLLCTAIHVYAYVNVYMYNVHIYDRICINQLFAAKCSFSL